MTDKQKIACYKAKINSLNDEIAGLTGKCEALEKDKENLTRTLEECNEEVEDLKAGNNILLISLEKAQRKIEEYEAGRAVILTADNYAEMENIKINGVVSAFQLRENVRKETAKEICDLIIEHWEKKQLVECDWFRVKIVEKYGVEVEDDSRK